MAGEKKTVEISAQAFDLACRGASLDRIDVASYLESILMRDAEHIRTRELFEGEPPLRVADAAASLSLGA
jgi:hypothetical protein